MTQPPKEFTGGKPYHSLASVSARRAEVNKEDAIELNRLGRPGCAQKKLEQSEMLMLLAGVFDEWERRNR